MRPRYINLCEQWRACGKAEVEGVMREFIHGRQYYRAMLDRVMDGRIDRVACEAGEEICDICRRSRWEVVVEEEIEDRDEIFQDEESK